MNTSILRKLRGARIWHRLWHSYTTLHARCRSHSFAGYKRRSQINLDLAKRATYNRSSSHQRTVGMGKPCTMQDIIAGSPALTYFRLTIPYISSVTITGAAIEIYFLFAKFLVIKMTCWLVKILKRVWFFRSCNKFSPGSLNSVFKQL